MYVEQIRRTLSRIRLGGKSKPEHVIRRLAIRLFQFVVPDNHLFERGHLQPAQPGFR
ncbi:hypothetical protein D3C81_2294100 [compost metagenome]